MRGRIKKKPKNEKKKIQIVENVWKTQHFKRGGSYRNLYRFNGELKNEREGGRQEELANMRAAIVISQNKLNGVSEREKIFSTFFTH